MDGRPGRRLDNGEPRWKPVAAQGFAGRPKDDPTTQTNKIKLISGLKSTR